MKTMPVGFWVRGAKHSQRLLVSARRAFAGFAACDEKANGDREHYLSCFSFNSEFQRHVSETRSTAQFDGVCGADWIWWDIDREDDIDAALADARALHLHLTDRWKIREDEMLIFMSGGKGFHVGVPTLLWNPEPSRSFNRTARRFAEDLAKDAGSSGIVIDAGIYDKLRLFRAPNSRHPKTGLRKRVFAPHEFLGLSIERMVEMARSPLAFDVPTPIVTNGTLAAAWTRASSAVAAEDDALALRRTQCVESGARQSLNELTMEFIRGGAETGGAGASPEAGRHRRLFAAAANLGEFGCPPALAHALLTEAALDCGITPNEVRRHIDNGIVHRGGKAATNE